MGTYIATLTVGSRAACPRVPDEANAQATGRLPRGARRVALSRIERSRQIVPYAYFSWPNDQDDGFSKDVPSGADSENTCRSFGWRILFITIAVRIPRIVPTSVPIGPVKNIPRSGP